MHRICTFQVFFMLARDEGSREPALPGAGPVAGSLVVTAAKTHGKLNKG